MTDERWDRLNRVVGFVDSPDREQSEQIRQQQQRQIRNMHNSAYKWLIAETCFTICVSVLCFDVGSETPAFTHVPADGQNHLYFVFMLQLLILNMLPHNAVKAYFVKNMRDWSFRKVKNFDHGIFLVHSIVVLVSWIIGLWAYHAGPLMNAIPDSGFFLQVTMIVVFCYLVYWSMIGLIVALVCLLWGVVWLYRCPVRRRQQRAERQRAEQRLLRQNQNLRNE